MKKNISLPYNPPFAIDDVKTQLQNYNREKVKEFIRRADQIMSINERLNHADTKGMVRKDLKATVEKLETMREYIFDLHKATVFKQKYFRQTYGKEAIESMDRLLEGIEHINGAVDGIGELIIFLKQCDKELKTKTGRGTADKSGIVTEIARAYLKYIDEPREAGGHFADVLCIILNDPNGTDRAKSIREARKKLRLRSKKLAK